MLKFIGKKFWLVFQFSLLFFHLKKILFFYESIFRLSMFRHIGWFQFQSLFIRVFFVLCWSKHWIKIEQYHVIIIIINHQIVENCNFQFHLISYNRFMNDDNNNANRISQDSYDNNTNNRNSIWFSILKLMKICLSCVCVFYSQIEKKTKGDEGNQIVKWWWNEMN